jgi:hypothetical protein
MCTKSTLRQVGLFCLASRQYLRFLNYQKGRHSTTKDGGNAGFAGA